MRTILEPPQSLVDGDRVRFGTFSGAIADVNLLDARPWSLPIPRALRALRLKEWQAFQFGNQRYFVIVAAEGSIPRPCSVSGRSSTSTIGRRERTTARSTAFSSSRTFPGHS